MKLFCLLMLVGLSVVLCDPRVCPVINTDTQLSKVDGMENTFKLTWLNYDNNANVDFVDLHFQSEGNDQVNVRVANQLNKNQVSQDGIVIQPGQSLRYSATYRVNGVSCDTPVYEYANVDQTVQQLQQQQVMQQQQQVIQQGVPQQVGSSFFPRMSASPRLIPVQASFLQQPIQQGVPLQWQVPQRQQRIQQQRPLTTDDFSINAEIHNDLVCPIINVEQQVTESDRDNTYELKFINRDALNPEWVDLHWTVNGQPQTNVRLISDMQTKVAGQDGIVLYPGDVLHYSSTYRVNGVSCDTPTFQYVAGEQNVPTQQQQQAQRFRSVNQYSPLTDYTQVYNPYTQQYTVAPVQRPLQSIPREAYVSGSTFQIPRAQIAAPQIPLRTTSGLRNVNSPSQQVIPAAICPNLDIDQRVERMVNNPSLYVVSFLNRDNTKDIDYVELHYNVADQESNVRIGSNIAAADNRPLQQAGIYIPTGANIKFYFTYSVNGVQCDTEHFVAQA